MMKSLDVNCTTLKKLYEYMEIYGEKLDKTKIKKNITQFDFQMVNWFFFVY